MATRSSAPLKQQGWDVLTENKMLVRLVFDSFRKFEAVEDSAASARVEVIVSAGPLRALLQ